MAEIVGTNVGAKIVPTDTADTYPSHDANYGKGGLHSVSDTTARNAISSERRDVGMMCYVTTEDKTYQLVGGVLDANWEELSVAHSVTTGRVPVADGPTSYTDSNIRDGSGYVRVGGDTSAASWVEVTSANLLSNVPINLYHGSQPSLRIRNDSTGVTNDDGSIIYGEGVSLYIKNLEPHGLLSLESQSTMSFTAEEHYFYGTINLGNDMNANVKKINYLADGTADGDAVNKGQLDAAVAGTVDDLTTGYLVKSDSSNLVNSVIKDNGTGVGIGGEADATALLKVYGDVNLDNAGNGKISVPSILSIYTKNVVVWDTDNSRALQTWSNGGVGGTGLVSINVPFNANAGAVLESCTVTEDLKVTGWTYWGNEATDGSWRQGKSGNNLVAQRREAGTWVTKQTISA